MATRHLSIAERRRRLAWQHRLIPSRRTDDVAGIVASLVAAHATDPATVYLSLAARMANPSIDAITNALYDERSVVRHHAMRRTLWVFEPAQARIAHAACTATLAATEWRRLATMLEQSDVTSDGRGWCASARERTIEVVRKLAPCSVRQIGAADPTLTPKLRLAVGKAYEGTQGAHSRVVQNLGFDGLLVRGRPGGSWTGSEYTWHVADDWVPGGLVDPALDSATATAELARVYLERFGPATSADLQWWTGWAAGATRAALAAIGAEPVTMETASGTVEAWMNTSDTAEADDQPWVALLPSLDPTLMGWKERTWYLGDLGTFGGSLFDRNGNGGHSIWIDGAVCGTWAQRSDSSIVCHYLTGVPSKRRREVERAAARLRELVGDTRLRPRFPAPIHAELAAGP